MSDSKVVCLLTSDWHLSDHAPVARSAEEDWFAAQLRAVGQVTALKKKYNCPIIHAGDLFDRHSPTPNLINWCLGHVPKMYAVAGQHDLPHHRWEDRRKSAFWTLVMEGRVTPLEPGESNAVPSNLKVGMTLHGFPFGFSITPAKQSGSNRIHLAVLHRYVWNEGNKHPRATQEQHVSELRSELIHNGYTHAVVGDNHKWFLDVSSNGIHVFNSGTLMRRKADERDYQPQVGLLHEDRSISTVALDCSEDKWISDPGSSPLPAIGDASIDDFLDELNKTDHCALSFAGALLEYMDSHKVSDRVREIIVRSLENK